MSRIAVVGGGVGGGAAARRLAMAGHDVTLIERSSALGGLVVSFAVEGTPLECFYHHIFPHEHEIIGLINELGLGPKLDWFTSTMGVLIDGKVWPFTSPLHLLQFKPLPFIDRIRTGIGALVLGRWKDWQKLDGRPARDWMAKYTSRRAAELVWDPLLGAKFGSAAPNVPAAWMWGRFQQRAAARKNGGELLGYMRGGFKQVFDALDANLRKLGVDVRLNTAVDGLEITAENGKPRVTGVRMGDETLEVDDVLFSGTLAGLLPLVPEEWRDPKWSNIGALGVECVILEMDRPLTQTYWTNVCDPNLPFGGIIEHTNMLPASDYGGRTVVYLSRYFTLDEPLASADAKATADDWVDALEKHFAPFDRAHLLKVSPFKTMYAAPLVTLGYKAKIPSMKTHIDGLTISTTAQIYPQDRGMSEAVRTGLLAADVVASS